MAWSCVDVARDDLDLNYREVLKGDNVGYKSQLSSLILSQSPPLMRWGWAIYILGICTQWLNSHFS